MIFMKNNQIINATQCVTCRVDRDRSKPHHARTIVISSAYVCDAQWLKWSARSGGALFPSSTLSSFFPPLPLEVEPPIAAKGSGEHFSLKI